MQTLNVQTLQLDKKISVSGQTSEKSILSDDSTSFKSMLEEVTQEKATDNENKKSDTAVNVKDKKLSQKIKNDSSTEETLNENFTAVNNDIIVQNQDNEALFLLGENLGNTDVDSFVEESPVDISNVEEMSDIEDGYLIDSIRNSHDKMNYYFGAVKEEVSSDNVEETSLSFGSISLEEFDKEISTVSEEEVLSDDKELNIELASDQISALQSDGVSSDEVESFAAESVPVIEDLSVKTENTTDKLKTAEIKKDKKTLFTVTDLRTDIQSETVKSAKLEDSTELKVSMESHTDTADENTLDMTLTAGDKLLTNNAMTDIASLSNQTAAADGSTFQQMLNQSIQQNAGEFVKAGNIVLKDNNEGTINMKLRPESLGNVKINLELTDKTLTGQITVASKEVLEAFKQNLDTLKEAFLQNGFENATFNLDLAENSNNGFLEQNQQKASEDVYLSKNTYKGYVAEDEDSFEQESNAYSSTVSHSIDVVA